MKSVGEQLRSAREAQERSIDDISQATRINKKFLDDLEHDIIPKLPPTYVQAFIRSFAQEVGLDPSLILRSLNPPEPPVAQTPGPAIAHAASKEQTDPEDERPKGQVKRLAVIMILLALAFAVSLFWLRHDRPDQPGFPDADAASQRRGQRS